MSNETEQFWAGDFGKAYLERNQVDWTKRIPFYCRIVEMTNCVDVFELGCNAGWNLRAIGRVDQDIEIRGCDVNGDALIEASKAISYGDFEICAARDIVTFYGPDWKHHLTMTAGVLIHIPEEEIWEVMRSMVALSSEYVLAIEYDSDKTEEVTYRGHSGRLWRRPYGPMYQSLRMHLIYSCKLGPEDGFGPGCTAWLLRKEA